MPESNRLSVPSNPARALRDLSRRQTAAAESNAENTTILQHDKHTDQQKNIPANLQSDNQDDRQTITPSDIQTDQPTNNVTAIQTDKETIKQTEGVPAAEPPPLRRADGRTSRPRQETADRTLVTSVRLAVSTVEQLDEYCWKNRQRKQDVIQSALDLYFASAEENT